jgi:hypothetical protein
MVEAVPLAALDGSSEGQPVGPEGSHGRSVVSDGKWMYFTVDTRTDGSHVWRQSFQTVYRNNSRLPVQAKKKVWR